MVRFGVAGYPPAFSKSPQGRDRLKILDWLSALGLDAIELQMTYGPRTKREVCLEYRRAADGLGISLSVHASYFIVLTSSDESKIRRSEETLKRTYELCSLLGARVLVLHPGPLYGNEQSETLKRFMGNLARALKGIGPSETGLFVETAGKLGQLGSTEEIFEVCRSVQGVFPCIDFGHVHARTLGGLGTEAAIEALFEKVNLYLRSVAGAQVHFHYTPIHYGPRGEISHKAIHDKCPADPQLLLPTLGLRSPSPDDGHFHPRAEPIATALTRLSVDCTVISETHDSQEEGALALKNAFLQCRQ